MTLLRMCEILSIKSVVMGWAGQNISVTSFTVDPLPEEGSFWTSSPRVFEMRRFGNDKVDCRTLGRSEGSRCNWPSCCCRRDWKKKKEKIKYFPYSLVYCKTARCCHFNNHSCFRFHSQYYDWKRSEYFLQFGRVYHGSKAIFTICKTLPKYCSISLVSFVFRFCCQNAKIILNQS